MLVKREGYYFRVVDDINTSPWGFWNLWAKGIWEAPLLFTVDMLLGDDGILLDIGAWVGPVSLWAARKPKRTVIAVEPDVVACEVLRANLIVNWSADSYVLPHMVAAPGTRPILYVHEPGDSKSNSVQKGTSTAVDYMPPVISLPELIDMYHPTVIKIDIEGGEEAIIEDIVQAAEHAHILLTLHAAWYTPAMAAHIQTVLATITPSYQALPAQPDTLYIAKRGGN